jgi:hypothetical protein
MAVRNEAKKSVANAPVSCSDFFSIPGPSSSQREVTTRRRSGVPVDILGIETYECCENKWEMNSFL